MINELVEISKATRVERKNNPILRERMNVAANGQQPRFLLISSIKRSAQDLQLLDLKQGDAFSGTRVPGRTIPQADKTPIFFSGPAAYNEHFPEKNAVVITFEHDEDDAVIEASLKNVSENPDTKGIPLVALKVNYNTGEIEAYSHSYFRNQAVEDHLITRARTIPTEVNDDVIVLVCSDSRVHPPLTYAGLPYAIQTLGGHIPAYTGQDDETAQFNAFLETWQATGSEKKYVVFVPHGKTEEEGQHCGAGKASLNPSDVHGTYLRPVIETLNQEASSFESAPPESPERRLVALGEAIKKNLSTYPAYDETKIEVLRLGMIDTVTGEIKDFD
ncbi:MAG: hypothetical protein GF411_03220 [Candidatus Lokiarchaeota archaeon]|nr:hypothetical protein [Candidatus Lokiarchaeota archaeon]